MFAIGGGLVVFGVVAFFAIRHVIRRYEAIQAEPITPCGLVMPGGELARVECGAVVCYCRGEAERLAQKAVT